jgi:hypothetical protein
LLYEVHDPGAYLTPDVVADLGAATVTQVGPNRVRLEGVCGHPRPDRLKVNVFSEQGWFAEGEISYAGPRAEARARLAADVLRERLRSVAPVRVDLIGVASVLGDDSGRWLADQPSSDGRDVRLRVAAIQSDRTLAERLPREVTALYTCGPAAAGASAPACGNGYRRTPATCRGNRCRPASGSSGRTAPMDDARPPKTGFDVPLYCAAHGRTGDKGNRSNISVIAWHPSLWPLLVEQSRRPASPRSFRIASRRASRATCCPSCTP